MALGILSVILDWGTEMLLLLLLLMVVVVVVAVVGPELRI